MTLLCVCPLQAADATWVARLSFLDKSSAPAAPYSRPPAASDKSRLLAVHGEAGGGSSCLLPEAQQGATSAAASASAGGDGWEGGGSRVGGRRGSSSASVASPAQPLASSSPPRTPSATARTPHAFRIASSPAQARQGQMATAVAHTPHASARKQTVNQLWLRQQSQVPRMTATSLSQNTYSTATSLSRPEVSPRCVMPEAAAAHMANVRVVCRGMGLCGAGGGVWRVVCGVWCVVYQVGRRLERLPRECDYVAALLRVATRFLSVASQLLSQKEAAPLISAAAGPLCRHRPDTAAAVGCCPRTGKSHAARRSRHAECGWVTWRLRVSAAAAIAAGPGLGGVR